MNAEERDTLAQWVANQMQRNLANNEDLSNLLNVLGKPFLEAQTSPTEAQLNNLKWETIKCNNPYQQTKNDDSKTFRILQNWLSENKGFAHLYGFKIWFHKNDENVIDRRKK